MLKCTRDLTPLSRETTADLACRREHIVPGLGFRITSPESLQVAGIDCSDEDRWSRLTAGIEIKSNYTEACYNLDEVFAWRSNNSSGLNDRSCHWDSASCPNEWRYLEGFNYNPNTTNSVITTVLSGWNTEESPDWQAQVFRTFEREGCDQGGNWHQWTGCEDERDECRELPYGVRSFEVSYQSEDSRTDECVFAGERGVFESGSESLSVWSSNALLVVVVVLLLGF